MLKVSFRKVRLLISVACTMCAFGFSLWPTASDGLSTEQSLEKQIKHVSSLGPAATVNHYDELLETAVPVLEKYKNEGSFASIKKLQSIRLDLYEIGTKWLNIYDIDNKANRVASGRKQW